MDETRFFFVSSEQWIVRPEPAAHEPPAQPAQALEVLDLEPEVAAVPPPNLPAQVLQQVVNLQEEERAQATHPDITRTGRVRKKPDRYGLEKERESDECQDKILVISAPPSRDITPQPSPNLSSDSSMDIESKDQLPWLPTAD